jgi:hypothetical protein
VALCCQHTNRLVSLPPCCANGKRDALIAAIPRPGGATVPVAPTPQSGDSVRKKNLSKKIKISVYKSFHLW